jgi:MEMO1 family protein
MADQDLLIRKSAVAGTFYPAERERLSADISTFINQVDTDRSAEEIVALVAPHAGYMYSGQVAAYAYRQLKGRSMDTVVVISPSHREYFEFSSVFGGTAYETPLGRVEIDEDAAGRITEAGGKLDVRISASGHMHSSEHALEVHLPFLQTVLTDFKLVAIVMGRQDEESCRQLGRALSSALEGRRAMIVASTDLSHFHTQQTARGLDQNVVDRIDGFDPEGLLADVAANNCEACGAGPMAAAMFAAGSMGATKGECLNYATSGEISGDFNQVVGYVSAIIYR